MLLFPIGLACRSIWLWLPALAIMPLMIAYSLLSLLVFAAQFTWSIVPPASRWLPAATPHAVLGLGGQVIVVLVIIAQGGLSAGSGQLVHVGAGALFELAILLFWYVYLHAPNVARLSASTTDDGMRQRRAQPVRH